ncbi:hypothetical protein HZC09_02870 [Candidatus Micrarchaeota archaeon]|nr:hypothetical protein [Candidatus Micrarchaeota archaeon]
MSKASVVFVFVMLLFVSGLIGAETLVAYSDTLWDMQTKAGAPIFKYEPEIGDIKIEGTKTGAVVVAPVSYDLKDPATLLVWLTYNDKNGAKKKHRMYRASAYGGFAVEIKTSDLQTLPDGQVTLIVTVLAGKNPTKRREVSGAKLKGHVGKTEELGGDLTGEYAKSSRTYHLRAKAPKGAKNAKVFVDIGRDGDESNDVEVEFVTGEVHESSWAAKVPIWSIIWYDNGPDLTKAELYAKFYNEKDEEIEKTDKHLIGIAKAAFKDISYAYVGDDKKMKAHLTRKNYKEAIQTGIILEGIGYYYLSADEHVAKGVLFGNGAGTVGFGVRDEDGKLIDCDPAISAQGGTTRYAFAKDKLEEYTLCNLNGVKALKITIEGITVDKGGIQDDRLVYFKGKGYLAKVKRPRGTTVDVELEVVDAPKMPGWTLPVLPGISLPSIDGVDFSKFGEKASEIWKKVEEYGEAVKTTFEITVTRKVPITAPKRLIEFKVVAGKTSGPAEIEHTVGSTAYKFSLEGIATGSQGSIAMISIKRKGASDRDFVQLQCENEKTRARWVRTESGLFGLGSKNIHDDPETVMNLGILYLNGKGTPDTPSSCTPAEPKLKIFATEIQCTNTEPFIIDSPKAGITGHFKVPASVEETAKAEFLEDYCTDGKVLALVYWDS